MSARTTLLLLSTCGLAACGDPVVGWAIPCDTDCDEDPINVAPTVTWTHPEDGQLGVPANTSILVSFSEPMDPDTLDDSTFTVTAKGATVQGSIVRYDVSAIFRPDEVLDFDTVYTVGLTTDITDASGLAMESAYGWQFTTGDSVDTEPPTVTFTDPVDLATDVPLDQRVDVGFSEPMDALTLTGSSFTVWQDTTAINGSVAYDGSTMLASFQPDNELLPDTEYSARVSDTAMDLAGNGLASDHDWTFTTREELSDWVPVDLGSLTTFVAVTGAGLTNSNSSGTTTLNGDVGLTPAATCLGDGIPCTLVNPVINGTLYANDPAGVAVKAKEDLTAAYIDAMGRAPGTIVDDLAGRTLPPGVYTSDSTMGIAVGGTLTLDAEGDANAVWIFQVGSSLTVNNDAQVLLINGANADNVFWGVFASSTLGSNVSFQGSILAGASNSVGTDSTVVGRLLCTTGQITLLSNTITLPRP